MLILQIPYSTYLRHSYSDVKREISKKGILLTFHVRNEFPTSVHPKNSLSFFHCKKKRNSVKFSGLNWPFDGFLIAVTNGH